MVQADKTACGLCSRLVRGWCWRETTDIKQGGARWLLSILLVICGIVASLPVAAHAGFSRESSFTLAEHHFDAVRFDDGPQAVTHQDDGVAIQPYRRIAFGMGNLSPDPQGNWQYVTQRFRLVEKSDDPLRVLPEVVAQEAHDTQERRWEADDAYALYQDEIPPQKHYGRAGLELFVLLVAGTALYWADAKTNSADWDLNWDLESWHKKLITGEGISFDTNLFTTNTINHAMAGSFYYLAARTNNLSIPMSLLFAVAGSTVWEFVGEFAEKVSINDLIMTPMGGMAIGEVLAQLGAFFGRGSNNLVNNVLSTLFAPPRQLHNWLDNNAPHRTGNVDSLGFTRDMFHQFSLWTANGAATVRNTVGPDRARDTTGIVEVGLEARLANVPNYHQPGQISRWLTEGNFSVLRLEATFSQDGLIDLLFLTKATLAGYFNQDIKRGDDGRLEGYSVFIGVATSFEYMTEQRLNRKNDKIAILHLPGPTVAFSYFHHGIQVDTGLDLYGDFALVRPYAIDRYLANGGLLTGAKSVLIAQHYYYAWGFTVAPHLRIAYDHFEVGGTFTYNYFNSIEGADRYPERITNDFNLTDRRTNYKVWAAYTLPNNRFKLALSFEHRYRHGDLLDVSDGTEENRYMGNVSLLF